MIPVSQGDLLDNLMRREPTTARPRRLPAPEPRPQRLRALPTGREELPLLDVRAPQTGFDQLLLPAAVTELFAEVHLELQREDWLTHHGLAARRTFLLVGPPGTGKTATAEAVADELGRELAVVNLAVIMSSYLGETAKNLASVLNSAAREPWVLLLDEFDALGKERSDSADHGELRRVVNAVLQMLDDYRGPSVLIATTNHPSLLDAALWRRFDEVVSYELPQVHDIRRLLRHVLRAIPRDGGLDIDALAGACKGLSQAEVVRVVHDGYRYQLLHGAERKLGMRDLLPAAERAQGRLAASRAGDAVTTRKSRRSVR